MVRHAVRHEDLEAALTAARAEASQILEQVNLVQRELQNTTFVGERAEQLATDMNTTMAAFVASTYDSVDELLRVIVANMNVVVTKLGGAAWVHQPLARGQAVHAEAARRSDAVDYDIDTDEMGRFAGRVDEWFETIVASYRKLGATIDQGTGSWHGPEKDATVRAVTEAIEGILGAPGGSGVRGVGSSLSGWVREQAALMTNA